MKNKRALILTGGRISKSFVEKDILKNGNNKFDCIIAVDKGLFIAHELGITIDYIVGDFDSVPKDILDEYRNSNETNVNILEYDPVKDATDTQIAIELAMELKVDEIYIIGGTGTRLDHVIANIHLLLLPLQNKTKAYVIDEHNKIYLLNHSTVLKKDELHGFYLSLLPLTQVVEGITLEGFKYPLNNKTYILGDSLGVSNEVIMDEASILLKSGTLIVIESKD